MAGRRGAGDPIGSVSFKAACCIALLAAGAALLWAAPGHAEPVSADARRAWECAPGRGPQWAPPGLWSSPSLGRGEKLGRTLLHQSDLANGALYAAALLGVEIGADPPDSARWTSSAEFEDDARDDLLADSESGRDDAATWSDVLLALTATAPVWLDVAAGSWLRRGDCNTALELFGETVEALTLTMLLTEITKVSAGRERPFQRECLLDPGYDDDCFEERSRKSFFSGHTSLASAGAGLLCRNTYRRETPMWGHLGRFRNPLPCLLGVGAAVGTGLLRIRADQHWLGDVLAGWAVGLTLGFFDLPGPFDLLRFRYRTGFREIQGTVLPTVGAGSVGARLTLRF